MPASGSRNAIYFATDSTKNKILPDQEKLTQGFVCMPEEFQATIKPRSQARAEPVKREWREAEKQCLNSQTKQWLEQPQLEVDKARVGI